MFTDETTTFLQSGCALIVGTVGPDGEPHAGRAWGLDVLDAPGRVQLLLDAADERTLAHVAEGGPLAVTGADVRTLRSLQLKGRPVGIGPATSADRARAERYCDAFFTDVVETDGEPRELLEHLVPAAYVACAIEVAAVYDQTPGPGAGAEVAAAPR